MEWMDRRAPSLRLLKHHGVVDRRYYELPQAKYLIPGAVTLARN